MLGCWKDERAEGVGNVPEEGRAPGRKSSVEEFVPMQGNETEKKEMSSLLIYELHHIKCVCFNKKPCTDALKVTVGKQHTMEHFMINILIYV